MRRITFLAVVLLILIASVSCINKLGDHDESLLIGDTKTVLPTKNLSAANIIFTPTITPTSTFMPTIQPIEAEKAIERLFLEPIDCAAPCFLGIVPGETSFTEAKEYLRYYGFSSGFETKYSYNVEYGPKEGLDFSITLAVVNQIVQSVMLEITPREQDGVSRKWMAYSPDTLILRYGTPSKVEFHIGTGQYSESYSMNLLFDKVKLQAQYFSYDVHKQSGAYHICPLTNKMVDVRIWFGSDPINPPVHGLSLEEVTGFNDEEFASSMKGSKESACLMLPLEIFNQ